MKYICYTFVSLHLLSSQYGSLWYTNLPRNVRSNTVWVITFEFIFEFMCLFEYFGDKFTPEFGDDFQSDLRSGI